MLRLATAACLTALCQRTSEYFGIEPVMFDSDKDSDKACSLLHTIETRAHSVTVETGEVPIYTKMRLDDS